MGQPASRGYSRPPLEMRQPIVTPRGGEGGATRRACQLHLMSGGGGGGGGNRGGGWWWRRFARRRRPARRPAGAKGRVICPVIDNGIPLDAVAFCATVTAAPGR